MSYRSHIIFSNLFFIANIVLVLFVFGFAYFLYHLQQTTFSGEGELYVSEIAQKANLKIDSRKTYGMVRPLWTAFAQGGEEQGTNMLAGTEKYMKQLGTSYVRLDHIFDDDYYGVVVGEGKDLQLDWTKLDKTVNSILAMGAKPYFSLGYMPSALASSKIDVPYDWNQWQWLVRECIKHYSGSSGKGIEGVYYEVWNEPDLESFGKWYYSGPKNYLTLYQYAGQAAKAARSDLDTQKFYFGGPSITAAYKNWIDALVIFTKSNDLPLDFISWHRYSYDNNRFLQDVLDMRAWISKKGNYQLIISEFGADSGKTNIYSSAVAGAHAVTVARQMLDSGLEWLYAFEVKDGPNQGDSGWGVLAHNSAKFIPKSRYRAYAMMQTMIGNRVLLQGEGNNVKGWAVKKGEEINIIASNYNFQAPEDETVPIEINNLVMGKYMVIWETLTGEGGESLFEVGPSGIISKIFPLSASDVLKVRVRKTNN